MTLQWRTKQRHSVVGKVWHFNVFRMSDYLDLLKRLCVYFPFISVTLVTLQISVLLIPVSLPIFVFIALAILKIHFIITLSLDTVRKKNKTDKYYIIKIP